MNLKYICSILAFIVSSYMYLRNVDYDDDISRLLTLQGRIIMFVSVLNIIL